MDVVSNKYLVFERGRKMRRDGKGCPPKPPEEATGLESESLLWIGYRIEMAKQYDQRKLVARQLNMPEPDWREEPWPT